MPATPYRSLTPHVTVAGQLAPDEIAALAAQGFTTIINNRPDGEEPGQPTAAQIEAAAHAAGLAHVHIPIGPAGIGAPQVEAMADALDAAPGPVLAFCRSGTRSTFLWALARATRGEPADELIALAAAQGYDLRPIAPGLRR